MNIESKLGNIKPGDIIEGACEECRKEHGIKKQELRLVAKGQGESVMKGFMFYVFKCGKGHRVQKEEKIKNYDYSPSNAQSMESIYP